MGSKGLNFVRDAFGMPEGFSGGTGNIMLKVADA